MKQGQKIWTCLLSVFGMAVMILDSKTALAGAKDGVQLCLTTVIPSLFLFLVFSVLINGALVGQSLSLLRPIGKLCGIPAGCESVLVLGLIGGYPVGAQGIYDALESGKIREGTAKRMLGFCNNAGPSFIFGMVGACFSSGLIPWILWVIQITSALAVGAILPNKDNHAVILSDSGPVSLPQAVQKALRSMAGICGWVVFFRIIITICNRWFLWLFPTELQVAVSGILELTNGCCNLYAISNESVRFILAGIFLSFGSLCVWMQTASVTGKLGLGMFIPGKILQTLLCFLLSALCQPILFQHSFVVHPLLLIGVAIVTLLYTFYLQKSSSKMRTLVV